MAHEIPPDDTRRLHTDRSLDEPPSTVRATGFTFEKERRACRVDERCVPTECDVGNVLLLFQFELDFHEPNSFGEEGIAIKECWVAWILFIELRQRLQLVNTRAYERKITLKAMVAIVRLESISITKEKIALTLQITIKDEHINTNTRHKRS